LKPLSVTVVGEAEEYRLFLKAGEACSSVAAVGEVAVWEEDLLLAADRGPIQLELWHFDLTQGHRLLARHPFEFKQEHADQLLYMQESLVDGLQFWLRLRWALRRGQADPEEWLAFFH
jgi:hypothetical protein